jgi:D-alanyl-D-alanine carboxypeptidase
VASAPTTEFPTAVFARISATPVSDETADEFQALLDDMAGDGGMVATVMTAEGTWSGAAGTADGTRPLQVDDQFAIGSVTKPLVAAQVMQLVDAGELSLDDLAADHLPPDLDFDTNGATIRQLLSHTSGLREPDTFILPTLGSDRQHVWTVAEVLELAGDPGWPAGSRFEYSNANYFLLGLIIEHVRGRPLAQVLRDGVLALDGVERLVYQPDERPSGPMAMPAGESIAALELGGGYLPSIASATGGGPAAAMASDAPSLARWWQAFCSGEIVSPASLNEMATAPLTGSPRLGDDYGLGLFNVADPYALAVGHSGADYGFASWAGCVPERGAVVVVLTNQELTDNGGVARPIVTSLDTILAGR